MTDQIFILVFAVTLAFAFGVIVGAKGERERRRWRNIKHEIDWMAEAPPIVVGGWQPSPRLDKKKPKPPTKESGVFKTSGMK